MRLARRPWFVLVLFGLAILASRLPLAPGQLFTFDDVNLAYSIGHFDIRVSQPHPPGYPLFVMEMRALRWLRFRRAESILLALALAGTVAALFLLAVCGNRIMGGDSGFCAAWLMAFNPVFWHAGVTSALRVQLAVVSIAVAAACWRAWSQTGAPGEGRWVLWSALALGAGAGIRPETGPLLFPLWAACALRARISWRGRGVALAAMAGVVAAWLLPAMMASGGPATFVKACLDYISDQASLSSGLFGAAETRWQTTFWRMMVWIFCGILGWGLAAVLAWRRGEGWGIGRERLAFLVLWFVPAFAFAVLVHIEDPGHALAMVPAVALLGGFLMNRALDNVNMRISRWHPLILASAMAGMLAMAAWGKAEFAVVGIPAACVAAGLLLRTAPVKNAGLLPRAHAFAFLAAPMVLLGFLMFFHHGWYYRGTATSGWRAAVERAAADLNSGLALTSYEQIRNTLAVDDHSIREVRRLAAERPGKTVVLWESGLTAWRKIAYYAPALPVEVLDHKKIRAGSPPVVAVWRGPRLESEIAGAAPLRVAAPAGARLVWVLNPATGFSRALRQSFALAQAGPVYYTDLPAEHGSRVVGEYEVAW